MTELKPPTTGVPLLTSLWDEQRAQTLGERGAPALPLQPARLRQAHHQLRRRQHLGQDHGDRPAHRQPVEVLWVKGSGGDLGTMKLRRLRHALHGQARRAEGRSIAGPSTKTRWSATCRTAPSTSIRAPPPSTRRCTPMCPSRMSTTCIPTRSSPSPRRRIREELTQEIFGDEIGWLPWQRPGYELGLWLEEFCPRHPEAQGRRARKPRPVHLGRHGDATATSARSTIINTAIAWFDETIGGKPAFGGAAVDEPAARTSAARSPARLMPAIRGMIGARRAQGRPFRRQRRRCWNSSIRSDLPALAAARHLLPRPFPAHQDPAAGRRFRPGEARSSTTLAALGRPRSRPTAPTTPPITSAASTPTARRCATRTPVVYLVPGVGMITFANDKATARISGEFYVNAINVMRGASSVSDYRGLPEQEAFDIEYWLLEEAKLQRMPKPKSARRPGRARHRRRRRHRQGHRARLLGEGACVVLADIDAAALDTARGGPRRPLRRGRGARRRAST